MIQFPLMQMLLRNIAESHSLRGEIDVDDFIFLLAAMRSLWNADPRSIRWTRKGKEVLLDADTVDSWDMCGFDLRQFPDFMGWIEDANGN